MQNFKLLIIPIAIIILLYTAIRAEEIDNISIINVELFSKVETIKYIQIDSPATLQPANMPLNTDEKWKIKTQSNTLILYQPLKNIPHHLPEKILLQPVKNYPVCISTKDINTRCYKGNIEITSFKNRVKIINKVAIDDYINATTASELPEDWPEEAVKAQAIAIHSYTLYTQNKYKCVKDSTQNQFYGGTNYEKPHFNQYIKKIKNIILIDQNKQPIEALFHSTCAGGTLNNEDVFGGKPRNYLRAKKCNYCKESNFYNTHSNKLSLKELYKKLKINNISFTNNETRTIKIKTDNKILTGYNFWLLLGQHFGWGNTPGIKYYINCKENNCKIESRGAGHAVGLCQWGAKGMAKSGCKYQEILSYYYRNIQFSVGNNKSRTHPE